MTVLVFIGVLVVLVLVHELGHFLTAKASGVRVLEFGIGYPPRLAGVRIGETIYSLNLLPLGGFVKMEGEEDPSSPRSLASKPLPVRFLVLVSGAGMNALLPVLIFAVLLSVPHRSLVGQVVIQAVAPGSPAQQAGVRPGDVVLEVDGHRIENTGDLLRRVNLKRGRPTTWTLLREKPRLTAFPSIDPGLAPSLPPVESTTLTVTLVPRWRPPEGQGPAGVVIGMKGVRVERRSYPVWQAIPMGFTRTWEMLMLLRTEVLGWFLGVGRPQIAGPIGIAQVTGEVAQAGWAPLMEFTALLSLNLAILNILPIPMLDGGRLLFLALEFLRGGRRVPPEREGLVHLVGFMLLILVVAVVSYFDILRILRGESLLR